MRHHVPKWHAPPPSIVAASLLFNPFFISFVPPRFLYSITFTPLYCSSSFLVFFKWCVCYYNSFCVFDYLLAVCGFCVFRIGVENCHSIVLHRTSSALIRFSFYLCCLYFMYFRATVVCELKLYSCLVVPESFISHQYNFNWKTLQIKFFSTTNIKFTALLSLVITLII